MMRIGYVSCSTREHEATLFVQQEALIADGCERVFEDAISSAKSPRPGFEAALDYLRPGDRLVVTRLSRLGRTRGSGLATLHELRERDIILECHSPPLDTSDPTGRLVMAILAEIAEWEHEVLSERTREGLARAREQGRAGGRPPALDPQQRADVANMRASGMPRTEIARTFGVHPSTIRRVEGEARP